MRIGVIFSQADSGTDPDTIEPGAAGRGRRLRPHHGLRPRPRGVRRTARSGPFGGPFPAPPYTAEHTFHEVLALFSHLAGVTSTIGFVTSVLVLPQRQTALAAKQIATIDLLSGGRLRVAVGADGTVPSTKDSAPPSSRGDDALEEQVGVLRRLWSEPLSAFSGGFHELDRVGINPLPARPIPIYLGTGGADPVCAAL